MMQQEDQQSRFAFPDIDILPPLIILSCDHFNSPSIIYRPYLSDITRLVTTRQYNSSGHFYVWCFPEQKQNEAENA